MAWRIIIGHSPSVSRFRWSRVGKFVIDRDDSWRQTNSVHRHSVWYDWSDKQHISMDATWWLYLSSVWMSVFVIVWTPPGESFYCHVMPPGECILSYNGMLPGCSIYSYDMIGRHLVTVSTVTMGHDLVAVSVVVMGCHLVSVSCHLIGCHLMFGHTIWIVTVSLFISPLAGCICSKITLDCVACTVGLLNKYIPCSYEENARSLQWPNNFLFLFRC